jgi:hypothetical protein
MNERDAKKAHRADQDRIAAENEAQLARTEGINPTPTQEENDRAKLGNVSANAIDDKQPDGSEEQTDAVAPARTPAPAPKTDAAKTEPKS